jgi:hypothetical protein
MAFECLLVRFFFADYMYMPFPREDSSVKHLNFFFFHFRLLAVALQLFHKKNCSYYDFLIIIVVFLSRGRHLPKYLSIIIDGTRQVHVMYNINKLSSLLFSIIFWLISDSRCTLERQNSSIQRIQLKRALLIIYLTHS